MYGIFTYIWVIFRAKVGKYSIHGAYGLLNFIHLTRLWIHITSIKSHLYQIVCFGDGVNAAGLPWSAAGRTNKAREHFGHAICYQCYRVKLNCWSNLHWHCSTQNTFWLHLLQKKVEEPEYSKVFCLLGPEYLSSRISYYKFYSQVFALSYEYTRK